MRVAIVGLGKIGLPLAAQVAGKGHDVIGADVDPGVVATVQEGRSPFPGEPELEDRLAAALADGRLQATTDTAAAVAASEVVLVVVPLVVDADRRPDFSAIDAATEAVAAGLRPGTLVSYETTLPLGTTRGRFMAALVAGSGLQVGTDLHLCHSPERVSSGTVFRDLRRYPKLVGGVDPASAARAVEFYAAALDFDERADLARPNGVWDLGSAEAAELAKLAETTYRDVNIAYANELAAVAESAGLDVDTVIDACNSQPFSHIHRPGVSVGGHCIPVYPYLLLAGSDGPRLPAVARAVNEAAPERMVARLEESIGALAGLRVVVLGLAYRQGVKEDAFSGTHAVVEALRRRGAQVLVHDPLFDDAELSKRGFDPYHLGDPCDAVVLHTAHTEYAELTPHDLPGVRGVADGRRLWGPERWTPATYVAVGLG